PDVLVAGVRDDHLHADVLAVGGLQGVVPGVQRRALLGRRDRDLEGCACLGGRVLRGLLARRLEGIRGGLLIGGLARGVLARVRRAVAPPAGSWLRSAGEDSAVVGRAVGSSCPPPPENSHRPTPPAAMSRAISSRHPHAIPTYRPVRLF